MAAATSKAFREDCRHPSLAQNADREMTVTVRGRCGSVCRLLAAMVDSNRFATYSKLKVVRGRCVAATTDDYARRIRGNRSIPHITSLELSFDPYDGAPESDEDRRRYPRIVTALLLTVADFLPNVRHVTVSDNLVECWALRHLSHRSPNLDSVRWRNQPSSVSLAGRVLEHRTRSLDMDGCTFREPSDPFLAGGFLCVLHIDADTLERVSIRNARYYVYHLHDETAPQPVPQRGLIAFVRRASRLTWFRSDLTPENVAMLKRERPDVTFVS
jgi:hypothetical protein